MALQEYDKAALFLDGSCMAEWQEGTASFPGTFTPVQTMAGGGTRRGFVRDEGKGMEVSATIRIRRDGTEWSDVVSAWQNGTTVVVTVWCGGLQFNSEGKINLGNLNMKEGSCEMNFVGAAPDILGI